MGYIFELNQELNVLKNQVCVSLICVPCGWPFCREGFCDPTTHCSSLHGGPRQVSWRRGVNDEEEAEARGAAIDVFAGLRGSKEAMKEYLENNAAVVAE